MSKDLEALSKNEEATSTTVKIELVLPTDLYERSLIICQRRQCTLEVIMEELLGRFMPTTPAADEKTSIKTASTRVLAIESDLRWIRWTRRRSK